MKNLKLIYPGLILQEEFLDSFELSQYRLAKDIAVSPRRINEIVKGKRAITVDTALRLAKYFGVTPRFWLNLQMSYDLVKEENKLAKVLQYDVIKHHKVAH